MKPIYLAVLSFLVVTSCRTVPAAGPTSKAHTMSQNVPQNVVAPVAQKVPHEMSLHGDKRTDPFYWMKERDTDRVVSYLNAENKYYETMTKEWQPLQDRLFDEMKARVKQDDASPPSKNGPYMYYTRYEKGLEYPIYCRRKVADRPAGLQGAEEITLDVNAVAKGHKYTSVSGVSPSPDHQIIVYGVDLVGRRFYDLHFRDLKTGKTMKQTVARTTGDVVWAEDGHTLFYSHQNAETLRSEKIFRYDLKTDKSKEIYFEKDETFSVSVGKSQNDKYVFINSGSFDSSEVYSIPALKPETAMKLFLAREPKHEYSVEDGDDAFYIMTNWKAENFRIMKTSPDATAKENWVEAVPHRQDVLVAGMLVLKNQIVLEERALGLSRIEILDRKKLAAKHPASTLVEFPDPAYDVGIGSNMEYDTDHVRFNYQSMVRPGSVYDYNFVSGQSTLVKQSEVPTYDASKYASERVWATAADGTKIPISLVYRNDKRQNGKNPLVVYGYGSYGLSMDPNFRISVFSLLDRGFVYAIAHIRGGSEMGRAWYEKGRMGFKKNTFSDFNSATEYLVKSGYGDPANVFAMGGSAGGLLMGAISNLRPELYRGIVSVVPFVDVLTTMLDPDIPLTTAEYEQWGNPNEKDSYFYIKSYSPYDNIAPKPYPAMLVMTGYHDSQVQYWEPAKYVAKIREATTSKQPILFRVDMEAGHAGASGRFQALKDTASQFTFVIKMADADR